MLQGGVLAQCSRRQTPRSVGFLATQGLKLWDAADRQNKTLLETPFFLNEFLKEEDVQTLILSPGSSMIRSYFDSHVGLNEGEFSRAARAAFEVYRDDQSRTFPLSQFREFAGGDATEKMLAAGILCGGEEATYMSHHLHHDYLASRHLVAEPMTWNRDAFDVLTFSASSFDAVAMAIEQIADSTRADLFVRKLYDWNAYSAAYSVAEAMQSRSYVSEPMLCIMLAVLAERRWDMISPRHKGRKTLFGFFRRPSINLSLKPRTWKKSFRSSRQGIMGKRVRNLAAPIYEAQH